MEPSTTACPLTLRARWTPTSVLPAEQLYPWLRVDNEVGAYIPVPPLLEIVRTYLRQHPCRQLNAPKRWRGEWYGAWWLCELDTCHRLDHNGAGGSSCYDQNGLSYFPWGLNPRRAPEAVLYVVPTFPAALKDETPYEFDPSYPKCVYGPSMCDCHLSSYNQQHMKEPTVRMLHTCSQYP